MKIAILLRELGAEIRDDDAAAGRELFDAGIDMAQKALAPKYGPDALGKNSDRARGMILRMCWRVVSLT